jgi:uncharacterized protein (DUF2062 family)
MWHFTKRRAARWMESLLHIHDTPERTAAAFALGVTIGFSPFVGLHSLIGLALAFLLNLNRVAVLAGCWVNLPWFMGPYYAAATAIGTWLTGTPMPPQLLTRLEAVWSLPGWRDRLVALGHLLRPLLLPYTLGSLLTALPLGLLTYRVALAFIHARRPHPTPPGPAS